MNRIIKNLIILFYLPDAFSIFLFIWLIWIVNFFTLLFPSGIHIYLVVALIYGGSLSMLYREIIAKPFAFCLPGIADSFSKSLLLAAWAGSLISAPTFLVYPDLPFFLRPFTLLSLTSCGASVFLMAALLCLNCKKAAAQAGILLAVIYLIECIRLGFGTPLAVLIARSFFLTLPAGLWISYLVCRKVGELRLSRMNPCTGTQIQIETAMLAREPARRENWIDRFFISRIQNSGASSRWRCTLGAFYYWLSLHLSRRDHISCAIVTIIVAAGARYAHSDPTKTLLLAIYFSYLVAAWFYPELDATQLLPVGRRDRFWATLATCIVVSTVSSLLVAAAIIFSQSFAGIMNWRPIASYLLYVPLQVCPISYLWRLSDEYLPSAIFLPLVLLTLIIFTFIFYLFAYVHSSADNYLLITLIIALSWLGFIFMLYWILTQRDLIPQSKR